MLPFVCLSRLSQFYQLSIHPHKEEAGDPGLPFLRDRRCNHSRFQLDSIACSGRAEEELFYAETAKKMR